MGLEFRWWSEAGRRTEDNRDYAGIGLRSGEALCILLDGSTKGRDSGQLVQRIAQELVDWYVAAEETADADALAERLETIHGPLSALYPQASAGYMLVHLDGRGAAVALHCGDCLLGHWTEDGAEWLNHPDTLANALAPAPIAAIARQPSRHLLTRSFRRREFMVPGILTLEGCTELLLATDGFWAELNTGDQARFLDGDGPAQTPDGDDRSVLRIRITEGAAAVVQGADTANSLYVRERP